MQDVKFPIDEELTFDVVVVGGGVAAVCAAVAAARNGCETALLEMDSCLGGNSGPMLGVHVSGAHSFHPYASETGIVEEMELEAARQRAKTRTSGEHYNISHQWDFILQRTLEQSGVRVFRNHQGRQALTDGRRVTAVVALDTEHFQTRLFHVRHGIVDGSGDGIVARDAGASYLRGSEAASQFGERSAREVATDETMGTSITALVRKCSAPVDFVMPAEFAERAQAENTPAKLGGHPASWRPEDEFCFLWVTESGGNRDTILDAGEIRREILYQLYRTWDNVKNHSFVEEARNWELTWVSPKSGKRESHRFLGDYVLTQTDVEEGRQFPDAIGYGGYGVDIHEAEGKRARVVFHSIPPLWSFPYRAGHSRDFGNLWLAGRLMSVSHLALGTVRLMRTLGCIGQGIGTAVALAKQKQCTASQIGNEHIEELRQTLLRQDATLLNGVNTDPLDLARTARVSASSEQAHGARKLASFLPLDMPRGVQLWDWGESFDRVEFYVRNTSQTAQTLTLRLQCYEELQAWRPERPAGVFPHQRGRSGTNRMEWGCDNTVSRFPEVATAQAHVAAGFEGYISFEFAPGITAIPVDPTSDTNRYNLLLDACPAMELGLDDNWYDFALRLRAEQEDMFTVEGDCHLFRLAHAPVYGEAANVANGHNRRYSTNPVNAWLSEPSGPLPQALTLEWDEPKDISSVHLTFDTIDRVYQDSPLNCGEAFARRCVTDYRLEACVEGAWRTLLEEEGNHQRFRAHSFEPVCVEALRLTVLGVRDPAFGARVYEVRVYA